MVLRDLRDLAKHTNAEPAFETRMAALRKTHSAKRVFIQRLDAAGLP